MSTKGEESDQKKGERKAEGNDEKADGPVLWTTHQLVSLCELDDRKRKLAEKPECARAKTSETAIFGSRKVTNTRKILLPATSANERSAGVLVMFESRKETAKWK